MKLISKSELAKLFNVNPSRITALLEEEKLVATPEGKIDLDDPINQLYIETRKETVPKFTGVKIQKDEFSDEEIAEVDKTLSATGKYKSKKEAELALLNEKILKEKKTNLFLDLKLAKEEKKVIETELLNKILIQIFSTFFKNLQSKPYQIIEKLRDIILTGEFKNNEDVKLLCEELNELYKDAVEESRKAMQKFYEA